MLELSQLYSKSKLSLLVGGDSLLYLYTWYKVDKLIENWEIITYPRGNIFLSMNEVLKELSKKWSEKIASLLFQSILPFEICNISSTRIREELRSREGIVSSIDHSVYQYIKEKGLYRK